MFATALHLSRQVCAVCGGSLNIHEEVRGGICSDPQCRHVWLQRQTAQRRAAAEVLRQKAVEFARQLAVARLGLSRPDALNVVLLPSDSRRSTRLTAFRKRQFQQHLAEIIREALEVNRQLAPPFLPERESRGAPQFAEEIPATHMACGTCQGFCCALGSTHAFLDVVTLRRYLSLRPELRPRDVFHAYLSRLPERSVAGSCVFHSLKGCTLPRHMRAHICNTYYCPGLQRFLSRPDEHATRPILFVATTESEVVRSTLVPSLGESSVPRELDNAAAHLTY